MARKSRRRRRAKAEVAGPQAVDKWAALAGRWTFSGSDASYYGPDNEQSMIGLAVGGQTFRDGTIRTTIKLARNEKTTAGVLLGFKDIRTRHVITQIGAYDSAYAISEFRPTFGFSALASAGRLSNINSEVDHEMSIRLEGQSLSVAVDGVNVISVLLREPLEGQGMGLFAWGDAQVVFRETIVETSRPRVFVMMPFSEPFETLYKDVIKPVAEDQLGFEIVRVDEIQAPGIILDDIQRQIAGSHAVVAEISTRNPNVFYELGYAHALGKPAVLLVRRQDSGDVPFDIKGYRAIHYDDSIGGKKIVEKNLLAHLEAVKRGGSE